MDLVAQEVCPPPKPTSRVWSAAVEACDSGFFELVRGPRTKAECKKGGYKEFGFKSQGQSKASLQKKAQTGLYQHGVLSRGGRG